MTIEEQQFRSQLKVLLRDLVIELRKLNDKLDTFKYE
jgi:hypothetical protein